MFKWLKNKASGKPEQPQKDMLEFVGGITGDAVSAVTKVTLQVNLLARNGTLNRQSLFLADNFVREQVRELEREFVFGGNLPQEVLSITLLRYCSVFASAYASIFFNREEGNPETVSAVRAMRLLATHRRYARLAYRRSPPKVDSTMVKIFRKAKSAGIADFRVPAYLGESRTSVSSEFAVSALFESAPLDNFAREQIEYFWRLLQHYSNRIPMKPYPGNLVPFAIGKDGKTYLDVPPIKTRAFQYVGPGIWALEAIEQTAKETGGAKMLKRFGEVLPGTDADTVVSMAKKVLAVWKGEKNRRRHERVVPEKSLTLLVVEGFSLVHRMVAYSEFVNSGGTLGASDGLKIIQLQRVTHIQSIVPKLVVSGQDRSEPREILTKLECASDNGFIERWYVSDQSESGVGLYVPGHRSWLSVGHLIAVRDERSTEWRVGIVRRISTVESGRTVGIEYLSRSAIPVRIKRHDDGASTSNVGRSGELFDGILTEGKENHLLAPARRVEGSRQLVFGSGKCLHAEMGAKINGARGIDGYSCSVRLIWNPVRKNVQEPFRKERSRKARNPRHKRGFFFVLRILRKENYGVQQYTLKLYGAYSPYVFSQSHATYFPTGHNDWKYAPAQHECPQVLVCTHWQPFCPSVHPALSAAGAHAEPFHFSTWPEAAQPAAILEGAIQTAIFASVTAEAAMSAVPTERSVISADQTADFEESDPRAEIWEETVPICEFKAPTCEETVAIPEVAAESWESRRFTFETTLFHSEEESWVQPETVAMGLTET